MTDDRLAELERLAHYATGDFFPDSGSAMCQRQAHDVLADIGGAIIGELVAEVRRLRAELVEYERREENARQYGYDENLSD
jgi:hypothetical protein